jgi:hypothetical protein
MSHYEPPNEQQVMHINHPHMLRTLTTLALVAVMAAGCSTTSASDASVFDQVRDLGQDLNRAVSATQDAATGYAEPQFAARAIDRASNASRRLAETTADIQAQELRTPTSDLVSVANRIVTQLTQGDVQGAETLRANSFVPLASQIAQMKGTLPATTQTPTPTDGTSIGVAFVIIVLVVGGVAAWLVRARKRPSAATTETVDEQPTAPSPEHRRSQRAWDQPHPMYPDASPTEPAVSENADSARTTRMRPIDIELRSLLEATVEQAREREWKVSLICPEVRVAGDPVRVSRAILAALGNAFLEGAELAGIVVDVVDDEVLISIGHDAPIDDQKATDIAVRLANQLAHALNREESGWSVAADGELYLTTVSAGAGRVIETQAGVSV